MARKEGEKMILRIFILATVVAVTCTAAFGAQYSYGPRYTGEEVLDELLLGKNAFFIRVGSGGCTGKGSFSIDVKKEEGVTPRAPHYILTVKRIATDECKALMDEGIVLSWDLEKDLGIKGIYSYSIRNMVHSGHPFGGDSDDDFLTIIRKHFTPVGSPGTLKSKSNPKGAQP